MSKTRESVRQSILANAGLGSTAVSNRLGEIDPELEAYRQELRLRLAGARGRTYTYTRPEDLENRVTLSLPGAGVSRTGLNRAAPTIGGAPAHGLGSDFNQRPGPGRPGIFSGAGGSTVGGPSRSFTGMRNTRALRRAVREAEGGDSGGFLSGASSFFKDLFDFGEEDSEENSDKNKTSS